MSSQNTFQHAKATRIHYFGSFRVMEHFFSECLGELTTSHHHPTPEIYRSVGPGCSTNFLPLVDTRL